jgi:hypothetical protein
MEARAESHSRTSFRALLLILGALCCSGATSVNVQALLDQADAAYAAGHYVYPARGSAMSLYHEALTLDPDNAEASRGLERLVEHFLQQAASAIEKERYNKAGSLISQARMVDPENPNIEPMARELALLENADRYEVRLDWRQVSERSSALGPVLKDLGARARRDGCHAVITVSSDSEGRWVYQQLTSAPGDSRIQAQIRIGSPSAVTIVCF